MSGPLAVAVKTAAAMTDLSETTIRKAIDEQELPAHRVGRAIRILVSDLEQWLKSLTRVGQEEEE